MSRLGAQASAFPSAELSRWVSLPEAEMPWLSWALMCASAMEKASAAESLSEPALARQSPRPRQRLLRRARSGAEKAERRPQSVAARRQQSEAVGEGPRSPLDAAAEEQEPQRPTEEEPWRSVEEREPRQWGEAYLSVAPLSAAESASW